MYARSTVVTIVALVLVSAGCSGTAVLPTTNEPTVAPAVSLEEFNRVQRACYERIATDRDGNRLFRALPSRLFMQEFSQEDQVAFHRAVRAKYGYVSSGTFFEGKLFDSFCQFKAVESIINFFPNQEVEIAFRSFLENRPTSNMLNKELNRILTARQADPHGPAGARFEAVFATPQQTVAAAIQPLSTGTGPRFNTGVIDSIMNEWLGRIALNPDQFQSQDAMVNIFEESRERGFIK